MAKISSQTEKVTGILEISDRGHGFLRDNENNLRIVPTDPFVSRDTIKSLRLREGLLIEAVTDGKRGTNNAVKEITAINGHDPDYYIELKNIDDFTVIDPNEMIRLETGPEPLGMRVMDLLTPIGKGQRGLIVAPPRTGKTILLQQIANGITTNHPEIDLVVLLIDERPEEVTDMRRTIKGQVLASSNDKDVASHVRIAKLTLEKVKRQVEFGRDVVVLLDSITRLGRAFNSWTKSSGRTMSGGVDIRALQLPKQIFGSARNIEGNGSLTIIATALIDTGSRMDEVIFQEFKGTGNMELTLDRQLANRRIFPAIDIAQSGTRKEELLIEQSQLDKIYRLRRHLDSLPVGQDVDTLVKTLKRHPSNAELLARLT
ncbi:MAG: transcription termination factor Rho [Sedimentisphaerales bacterium]|nr:transcription termination factor Rho [Sedimentisphaerales bacterium]